MARNATFCYILGSQVANRAKALELKGDNGAPQLAGGPMGLPDSGVGRHVASSLLVSRKPGTGEVSMLSVVDCLVWCVNTDDTESESPAPSTLPGSW